MKAKATRTPEVPATEQADKPAITVVGVGNEFRGDDAVGPVIVRQLKEKAPAEVKTVELVGDQSYLLELMRSTDVMIIVDAVQSKGSFGSSPPTGTIFRIDAVEEPVPGNFFSFSTHSMDSVQAIELARALNTLPTRVFIYGIVGRDFSYGSLLSPEVIEAIEIVQTKILNDLDCILKNENC